MSKIIFSYGNKTIEKDINDIKTEKDVKNSFLGLVKKDKETAFYEWERNLKDDDDIEYYKELFENSTHEEMMKAFYYYCSNYDDLKHIKEG